MIEYCVIHNAGRGFNSKDTFIYRSLRQKNKKNVIPRMKFPTKSNPLVEGHENGSNYAGMPTPQQYTVADNNIKTLKA